MSDPVVNDQRTPTPPDHEGVTVAEVGSSLSLAEDTGRT